MRFHASLDRTVPGDGVLQAASVPACAVCAGAPLLAGPLAAFGLLGPALVLHGLLLVLAPLNVLGLWLGARRHGARLPLLLGGAGSVALLGHAALAHLLSNGGQPMTEAPSLAGLVLVWLGSLLVLAGAWLDRSARRRNPGCTPADYWRTVLLGTHPGLRRWRQVLGRLPSSPRCVLCHAPFAGPGAPLMRLLGKGLSAKNPRLCADCLVRTPLGGAEIEVSLLFADVRGSTGLAERVAPTVFMRAMNRFYAAATEALVETDALIDKFVGDEVIGLYVPGFAGPDHARQAMRAAEALLRATGHADPGGAWLPVGIGVHTGIAFVGAVGTEGGVTDVTALGDVVNTTARLAAAAGAGEILVTEDSARAAGLAGGEAARRRLRLRGRREPLAVRVCRVAPPADPPALRAAG